MDEEHHEWGVEIWNALTHGAGFLFGVAASAVLVTLVALRGTGWQLAGALVFCISLVTLYAASTLYHSIPHLATKRRMKIFDHCAIYALISGTYTPFLLVSLRDRGGWWMFAAVWVLAVAGIIFKLFYTGRFKALSTILYLAMGWVSLVAIKAFLEMVPATTLWWLLAGGLAYTLGTVFYMSRARHAHAIWHGFVLAGSACHFVAVALQTLGPVPVAA
jgi:hemolysin III